jgi:hypothetical protein
MVIWNPVASDQLCACCLFAQACLCTWLFASGAKLQVPKCASYTIKAWLRKAATALPFGLYFLPEDNPGDPTHGRLFART